MKQHAHFVGIGGSGMAALAELLLERGHKISGSDVQAGANTRRLQSLGVEVRAGHAGGIPRGAKLVVHSSAVAADNPELQAARGKGLKIISRGALLAQSMRGSRGIAVAGTHGKSTTTALCAHILERAGLEPSALVGGRVLRQNEWENSGARAGRGEWFAAEADESDGSFLQLRPEIAVITNIEAEHLEHYGSADALHRAFAQFAAGQGRGGCTIVGGDCAGVQKLLPQLQGLPKRRVVQFGLAAWADVRARRIAARADGMRFGVEHRGAPLGRVRLPLHGLHNVQNALAALAAAMEAGVPFAIAAKALPSFGGVARRFETRARARGIWLVEDYAHHPTEVRATLQTARALHKGRVVAAFQPHRYSRTRALFAEFAGAFNDADVLQLVEIDPAFEAKAADAPDAAALARAVRKAAPRLQVQRPRALGRAAAALQKLLQPGDLALVMGAGGIGGIADELAAWLQAPEAAA